MMVTLILSAVMMAGLFLMLFAKDSGKTFEEAVSYNRKHLYVLPKDKKAIYEELKVKTGLDNQY